MIDSIKLHNLRNGELNQFMADTLAIVNNNDPAGLKVQAKYDALAAARSVLSSLFKRSQSNPITPEIEAADLRRDNAVNGLAAIADGHTCHWDPEIRKQGAVLAKYLDMHGNIARDNYQSETNTLNAIVADCKARPELAAAVAALQVGGWLTEIEAANNAFNALYLARTENEGDTATDSQLKAERVKAYGLWYDLRNHLVAHATISEKAEPYNKAVNRLNALIAQYNGLLAARAGRNGNDNGTTGSNTNPAPGA